MADLRGTLRRQLGSRATVGPDLRAGVVLGVESVPDGLASGLLAGVAGCVDRRGASERLDLTVERHVQQFWKAAPTAVAATKRLLRDVHGHRPADVMARTVDAIANQRVSAEGQEGLRAFLEKRPASWTTPR
jgi:methylglutaconyl-CoA hydratase